MTRIQVQSLDRRTLEKDGSLGDALQGLAARLAETSSVTRMLVVRPRSIDTIDPTPLHADGVPTHQGLIGMARSETRHGPAEALGLAGRARRGPDGPEEALLFLEWPDLRWWWWRAPMVEGQVRRARSLVRDARWGDPMPDGLGRWWSRARRHRAEDAVVPMQRVGVGSVH